MTAYILLQNDNPEGSREDRPRLSESSTPA